MDTNQLYDKIVGLYGQYLNHVNFVEKKKKDFIDKKKEVAQMLMDADNEEAIEKISFEVFIEDKIHANDINLIFNNLYTLVEAYIELNDSIILPKEITDLCTNYSDIVMRTMFVVNNSLICEERVKGSLDKVRETIEKTGQMKDMAEQFRKMIDIK